MYVLNKLNSLALRGFTQGVSSPDRFDLERLSNDLPFVKPLGWNQKIVDGFYPQTTYRVGGEFPARPDNFEFQDLQNIKIKDLMDYDRRIREAIHQQAVYTVNGDYYSLNDSTGINYLGSNNGAVLRVQAQRVLRCSSQLRTYLAGTDHRPEGQV
ncbi:unnamed protein product [Timema podura]|uniref:Hemocyanin middle domain-containing protein n=1 Tax=Timema podura TaxID=61482 RepID=A0ABN7P520_TIMPD|nr:unnamed protein product [Timema podura]